MSIHSSWRGFLGHSSGFPGTEVDGARGGSWGRHCFTQLYLTAKPPHMGVDVDGAAYCLHRPTAYGCQPMVQGPLTDAALLYLVTKLLLWVPLLERTHTLRLSDKGVEFLVKHCLVQLPHAGWCKIQSISSQG
jgi:hypothetical protein